MEKMKVDPGNDFVFLTSKDLFTVHWPLVGPDKDKKTGLSNVYHIGTFLDLRFFSFRI